jgi:hypothetical protein
MRALALSLCTTVGALLLIRHMGRRLVRHQYLLQFVEHLLRFRQTEPYSLRP